MQSKKIVLIPAYEPTHNLIDLLEKLKKKSFIIIVVDDGSGIKYKDIFKEAEKYAEVLSYDVNNGKGFALKFGFKYIEKKYVTDYVVVTMDSDGQHTPEDAIKLLEYAENNRSTLVLGKRLRDVSIPLKSKFGNSATRLIFHLITKQEIYDTQTGLRAFTNELMKFMLEVDGKRFEYEMKVLLECARNKIPLKEIEIKTIYIDNNSHTHFDAIKDSLLVYKEIFKFGLSSFVSFIIDFILYSIFIILFNKLVLSNILARIISASINYNMNKKIVFKSKNNTITSALQYFALAILIIILNSFILKILVVNISINQFIAKLITEIILFFISWFVQKNFIFNKRRL